MSKELKSFRKISAWAALLGVIFYVGTGLVNLLGRGQSVADSFFSADALDAATWGGLAVAQYLLVLVLGSQSRRGDAKGGQEEG